ncbi:hypothetical protein ACWEWG_31755, partial [Streptomyces sp. NPDC003758]
MVHPRDRRGETSAAHVPAGGMARFRFEGRGRRRQPPGDGAVPVRRPCRSPPVPVRGLPVRRLCRSPPVPVRGLPVRRLCRSPVRGLP